MKYAWKDKRVIFHLLLVSCPNWKRVKSYVLCKFMPQVKIIGHFSKLVNFMLNFEDLNGFNCKNSKLRDCISFQYLSKLCSFVSKFKSMSKLWTFKFGGISLNSCIPCKLQILDNLICGHLFHFKLGPWLIWNVPRPIMPKFELHMGKCKGNSWFCKKWHENA